jgi:hypothetical protein
LVRRASDRRLIASISSCHFDMMDPRGLAAAGIMPAQT